VSHTGEIFPAGFLPVNCGRFPRDSVIDAYQNHPVFRALRDPDGFKGRCGVCEYRRVCGGSRARAFALTGDYLETDPDCSYQPRGAAEIVHEGHEEREEKEGTSRVTFRCRSG
jgi:AdoMet-dependent heme synthase